MPRCRFTVCGECAVCRMIAWLGRQIDRVPLWVFYWVYVALFFGGFFFFKTKTTTMDWIVLTIASAGYVWARRNGVN